MKSGADALVEDEADLPAQPVDSDSSEEQPAFPVNVEDAPSDDSSDEEVLLRVGKIPLRWYDDYEHAGYTVTGDKVAKKEGDELDEFLRRQKEGSKDWWREIEDKLNNKTVKLS